MTDFCFKLAKKDYYPHKIKNKFKRIPSYFFPIFFQDYKKFTNHVKNKKL